MLNIRLQKYLLKYFAFFVALIVYLNLQSYKNMTVEYIIIIVVLAVGFAGIFWIIKRKEGGAEEKIGKELNNQLQLLQNQISEMNKIVDNKFL